MLTLPVQCWQLALPKKFIKRANYQLVSMIKLINIVNLVKLCEVTLMLTSVRQLPSSIPQRGKPRDYTDAQVMAVSVIARIWQLSYERITLWLAKRPQLAKALGFKPNKTISSSQLSRRIRKLGLLPFFILFLVLVGACIRAGIIKGTDVIIDTTILKAWTIKDKEATWNYAKKFGYKVHMLICRYTMLPIMFAVTDARRHDSQMAIPLLAATKAMFSLAVKVVRADAAYWSQEIRDYVSQVLKAKPFIDYNVGRSGKKWLASLEFLNSWTKQNTIRARIERFFGIFKAHFGLSDFAMMGMENTIRFTMLTCISVLMVAIAAHSIGQPHLARSPTKVLAAW